MSGLNKGKSNQVSPKTRRNEKFDDNGRLKRKRMLETGKTTFDLEATFREIDERGRFTQQSRAGNCHVRLGLPLDDQDLDDLVVIDPDGSGEIDISEFAWTYYNRRKLIHGGIHTSGGGSNTITQSRLR